MNIDDKVCIICYEKVGILKYNTICSCKFYYHLECYLEWNKINPICLICRNPVSEGKILETINPLCLNIHIPAVREFLEIDLSNNYIENSSSIESNNYSDEILNSRKCALTTILFGFFILFCIAFIFLFFNY